jgi:hypothetical protein
VIQRTRDRVWASVDNSSGDPPQPGFRTGRAAGGLHHWALAVRERRGHNKATIAVANKLGRIVWAVWTKDVPYAAAAAA